MSGRVGAALAAGILLLTPSPLLIAILVILSAKPFGQ